MNLKNKIEINQLHKPSSRECRMHRKVRKCKYLCKFNLMSLIVLPIVLSMISICRASSSTSLTEVNNEIHRNNSYYFEVNENTIDNQLIGEVSLVPNNGYRLGNSVPEFRFDSTTGQIYTTKINLDRERQQYYNLILLSNQPTKNPIQVKIKLRDVNDNYPNWQSNDIINRQISENAPIGTKMILDSAQDADEDLLRYELIYCSDDQTDQCTCDKSDLNSVNSVKNVNNIYRPFKLNFNVNNSILNLELNERLDRELISSYNCKLCVFDLMNQSNSRDLHIEIFDENDPPSFSSANYSTTVNHNLKKDDLILTVNAIDLDQPNTPNSKLIYSLHNEYNMINSNLDNVEDFYINKSTGDIHASHDGLPTHCTHKLDNQINNNQQQRLACVFTVLCEDQGYPKQNSKAYVTVYLTSNDNQHVPEIKILYFNHRFVQYAVVDQDAVKGSAVAGISVIDADNGQSGQTSVEIVSGNELEHFYLDSEFANTGSYVIRVNHNFSSISSNNKPITYNLTIKATDFGKEPLSSTQNLQIKINNELTEDHKPVFNQVNYRVEIDETAPIGSFVCLVNIKDQQSIAYLYSLSGNNSDYFHIDSQTGMVTLAKQLDKELINDLELKVFVRDTHRNSKWSSTKIHIIVNGVNAHKPQVIKSNNVKYNYEIIEQEHKSILRPIEGSRFNYEFSVVDLDDGLNGSVIVELLYDYNGLFFLNTTSYLNRKEKLVHLYSSKELDYETTNTYDLIILLSDLGTPKQSSQYRIRIEVQDQDDLPASVYPKHYFINLNNFQQMNSIQIQTIDLDKRSPTRYYFNFNHNHKNLNFVNSLASIDEQNGNIMFKRINNLSAYPKYLPFNVTCDLCDRLHQQATIHLYLEKNEIEEVKMNNESKNIVISEFSELRTILNVKSELFKHSPDSSQLLIIDGDLEQSFTIENEHLILAKKTGLY